MFIQFIVFQLSFKFDYFNLNPNFSLWLPGASFQNRCKQFAGGEISQSNRSYWSDNN